MEVGLLVLGGGAAGLAAARTGRRLGRSVALVEAQRIGGDCTFTGCVPSKTLIEAASRGVSFSAAMTTVRDTVSRIASTETADVLRREGITPLEGSAAFVDRSTVAVGDETVRAERVIVATGSAPRVPPIAGLHEVPFLTTDTVWTLTDRPTSVILLGGGPVGCELAQALRRFGAEVTLVEQSSRLLGKEDPAASSVIGGVFARDGIDVRTGVGVVRVTHEDRPVVHLSDGTAVTAERLVVAVGRSPRTADLGLQRIGVHTDDEGHVRVDDRMATNVKGIHAAGDVTGIALYTHAADEMGRVAAINAFRPYLRMRFDPATTPRVTFTSPEVAQVGLTEPEATGHRARVAELPMSAVDRAITAQRTDGFVKLVAGPRRGLGRLAGGRLLGATVVAERAGETIGELALAVRTGMFVGRLAQTVHAYPTWSTGVRSTAAQFLFEVDGRKARRVRPGGDG